MGKNFANFISSSPKKTPPMKVTVTGADGKFVDEFDAPAGFQMERYVMAHYPADTLEISWEGPNRDFMVRVTKRGQSTVFLTYKGIYQRK